MKIVKFVAVAAAVLLFAFVSGGMVAIIGIFMGQSIGDAELVGWATGIIVAIVTAPHWQTIAQNMGLRRREF